MYEGKPESQLQPAAGFGRRILKRRGNWAQALFAGALAVSLIAHGYAFTLLLHSPAKELGSVDVATSAISVNLETTDVIDAMESAAAKEAASSPAGATQKAISETKEKSEEARSSEAEVARLKAEQTARPAALANAERQPIEDEAETIKRIKEAAARERQAEEAVRTQKPADAEEIEKTKREKSQQSAAVGGIGATGAEDAPQSGGRVSASQGSILNYGASLRALISSNTPRNIRRASIRLAFSIAPTGGLTAVSVLTPSGKQEVDKRMVELVRTLSPRFPPPPAGASASQLSFNIEIIFR
jgi:protein TonB